MGQSSRIALIVLAVIAGFALAWATLGTEPDTSVSRSDPVEARTAPPGKARERGRHGARRVMVDGEPRKVARALNVRAVDGASVAPWPSADSPRGARTSIQDLRRSLRSGVQRLAVDLGLVGERADAVERLLLDAEARLDALQAGIEDGSVPLDGMHERLVAERATFSDAVLQELGREHAEAVYQRLGGR